MQCAGSKGVIFGSLLVFLLLFLPTATADQTQLYSRILLTPYYRDSTTAGVASNSTVVVNPPDGLTGVYSSILTWDVFMTPAVTFSLRVNNQSCNTPTYNISTTYSGAAQAQVSFDCSNIITKKGNYSIQLTASKNTGAMNGYLDLTYTNQPIGTIELSGTEYTAGDDGTIFLLLKDANGVAVTNATCLLDIYYPLSPNNTHVEWINNGLMRYLEEGLYYYDFVAPLYSGVYMVNAQCVYLTSQNQYYTISSGLSPTRNVTIGTYSGDPFVLDDYGEWLYTQCDSGTAGGGSKVCDSYYEWNMTAGGLTNNVTQLFVQYLGENNGANLMTMYWWNWSNSSWVALANTLLFKATASSGVPIGVDEYLSNTVPLAAISPLTRVRIRIVTTSGSSFKQWDNFLALKATQFGSTIQDLRGSGEIHVTSNNAGTNQFFKVDSCNGFLDGRCGIFTDDNEFDLVEGEIEDYLNVSASTTRTDVSITFETPFSVDCTALYWIKWYNGTGWQDFTSYTVYSQPSAQDCIVTLYQNLRTGTTYQYWLKMDNYMKWEVEYTQQVTRTFIPLLDSICSELNFSYVTPITDTTPISNDTIIDFCHRSYDDLYYISQYYNDSLSVSVSGEYASYLQEMRFYRQELYNRYALLSTATDNTSRQILQQLSIMQKLTIGNLTQIHNQLSNLSMESQTQITLLNQILTYLQTTIYPYLTQMWGKLLGIEGQLNTTIAITNRTLAFAAETNTTTHGIQSDLQSLNVSMINKFAEKDAHIQSAYDNTTLQISQLRQNMTASFLQTWSILQMLNSSQSNTQILNFLTAIDQHINTTQQQVQSVNQSILSNMNLINASLGNQLTSIQSNTSTIIGLLSSMNLTNAAQYDNLHSFLQNLSIQISAGNNLTQQNISDLRALLLSINGSLSADVALLNASLTNTRTDILAQLNSTLQSLTLINQSLSTQIQNTQALILASNQSNAAMIALLSQQTSQGFNTTLAALNLINSQQNQTSLLLGNLSLQLTQTESNIMLGLALINTSLTARMNGLEAKTDTAIGLISNLSVSEAASDAEILARIQDINYSVSTQFGSIQQNFSEVIGLLKNISQNVSVDFSPVLSQMAAYHTSTSQNISLLQSECAALNSSMAAQFSGLNATLTQMDAQEAAYHTYLNQSLQELYSITITINDTVTNISAGVDYLISIHNVSTTDLTLSVTAPAKCLNGTNWVVTSTVKDSTNTVMSPLDNVGCNVTTDLWGTAQMGYVWLQHHWKYIHVCDPTATTFNWSVDCQRI